MEVVQTVNGGTETSQISIKYLHLCFKDEQKSYSFWSKGGLMMTEFFFVCLETSSLSCLSNG